MYRKSKNTMKQNKLYFDEFHIAGRQYHDADEVWQDLNIGMILHLERDFDNRFDKNAVAIIYRREIPDSADNRGPAYEDFLLGYVPRNANEPFAALLEMGWDDIFECRLSKKDEAADYENQLRVTVRIKRKR